MKKFLLITFGGILIMTGNQFSNNKSSNDLGNVANSAEEICPIKVGETIPDLTLKTYIGEDYNLTKAVSQKPSVIIVFRGTWCPYCNMYLSELKDAENKLIEMGYQIIAISADKPEFAQQNLDDKEVRYTLLADNEAVASKALGLAFKVEDNYLKMLKQKDVVDLEEASGNKEHILPVPAAFVVDTEGVIQFSYVNSNYRVRINPNLLLKAAELALDNE